MKISSITEAQTILKKWGSAFKQTAEDGRLDKITAQKYYQICVDAHEGLSNNRRPFHNSPAAIRAGLTIISGLIRRNIKSRQIAPEAESEVIVLDQVVSYFDPVLEEAQGCLFS